MFSVVAMLFYMIAKEFLTFACVLGLIMAFCVILMF